MTSLHNAEIKRSKEEIFFRFGQNSERHIRLWNTKITLNFNSTWATNSLRLLRKPQQPTCISSFGQAYFPSLCSLQMQTAPSGKAVMNPRSAVCAVQGLRERSRASAAAGSASARHGFCFPTHCFKQPFLLQLKGTASLKFIIWFTVDMSQVIAVKVFQCPEEQRPTCAGPQLCVWCEAQTGKHNPESRVPALSESKLPWSTQIPAIRSGIQRTWKKDIFFCASCGVWCCACEVLLTLFSFSDVLQDFPPNF